MCSHQTFSVSILKYIVRNNSLMASNITTLVEKAKQGDADAFSTLYQMYYPKLKGICINILREDKAVVDDLVQDAFILAFVSLKDLKNTHRFSQWLTSITTNLVLKYQEKGKRYDFISLSDIEDEFSSVLEDGNTSKQSISYEEIMAAIDSLPEGYKKIFNMSVLDGLSHQEISELLDIAPHSSSSHKGNVAKHIVSKSYAYHRIGVDSHPCI